eukprot:TRINITY_DN1753_c0_g1_i8.p1 TRINITY_DN1753_c0_g1~~TRINITY_DN1753_c0_g1_i8.p1  ORF type:complete len:443 (-),score=23.30 TRINITY_DN1753_c0_g1_i8:36-1364(-)
MLLCCPCPCLNCSRVVSHADPTLSVTLLYSQHSGIVLGLYCNLIMVVGCVIEEGIGLSAVFCGVTCPTCLSRCNPSFSCAPVFETAARVSRIAKSPLYTFPSEYRVDAVLEQIRGMRALMEDVKASVTLASSAGDSSVPMSGGKDAATGMHLRETWAGVINVETVALADVVDNPEAFLESGLANLEPFQWNPALNEKQQMPQFEDWLRSTLGSKTEARIDAKEVQLKYRMVLHPSIAKQYGVARGSKQVSGFSDVLFSYGDVTPDGSCLDSVRALAEVKTPAALEQSPERCVEQAVAQLLRMNCPDLTRSGSWRPPISVLTDLTSRCFVLWVSAPTTIRVLRLDLVRGLTFLSRVLHRNGPAAPLVDLPAIDPSVFDLTRPEFVPCDIARLSDLEVFDLEEDRPKVFCTPKPSRTPLAPLSGNRIIHHSMLRMQPGGQYFYQ